MKLYPYTVYKFKMVYANRDDWDVQERYVVAKSEDEAIKKFETYLKMLSKEGFATPASYSAYPTVEIDYVI